MLAAICCHTGWKAAGSKVLDVEEGQSGAESRVLHSDHHHIDWQSRFGALAVSLSAENTPTDMVPCPL